MGREATCTCVWAGKRSTVKALIEPPELILRGELRKRVPIAKMQSIEAERDQLRFSVEGESVALLVGSDLAAKWADALLKPPPTLAKKLGITAEKTVWMVGPVRRQSAQSGACRGKICLEEQRGPDPRSRRFNGRTTLGNDARSWSTQYWYPDLVHLPQGSRPPAQRESRPHHRSRHRHCGHKSGVCFRCFLGAPLR